MAMDYLTVALGRKPGHSDGPNSSAGAGAGAGVSGVPGAPNLSAEAEAMEGQEPDATSAAALEASIDEVLSKARQQLLALSWPAQSQSHPQPQPQTHRSSRHSNRLQRQLSPVLNAANAPSALPHASSAFGQLGSHLARPWEQFTTLKSAFVGGKPAQHVPSGGSAEVSSQSGGLTESRTGSKEETPSSKRKTRISQMTDMISAPLEHLQTGGAVSDRTTDRSEEVSRHSSGGNDLLLEGWEIQATPQDFSMSHDLVMAENSSFRRGSSQDRRSTDGWRSSGREQPPGSSKSTLAWNECTDTESLHSDSNKAWGPQKGQKTLIELLVAQKGNKQYIPGFVDSFFVNFFHESRRPAGEAFLGAAILLNALLIGVSCDHEPNWTGWLVFDTIFAAIFLFEMIVKLRNDGCRGYFRESTAWGLFELLLVPLAWAEVFLSLINRTGGSLASSGNPQDSLVATLRVLRLLRVARVLRVVRLPIFNELMMMINGAVGGFRTLLWSQVLIAFFLYVLALILRESLGDVNNPNSAAEHFSTLARSYFTSFRCLVAGDCNGSDGKPIFATVTNVYGWGYGVVYAIATVLMTFGLFNVIVAIYVENTVAAARHNVIRQKQLRLTDQYVFSSKVLQLVEFIWNAHQDHYGQTEMTSVGLLII